MLICHMPVPSDLVPSLMPYTSLSKLQSLPFGTSKAVSATHKVLLQKE